MKNILLSSTIFILLLTGCDNSNYKYFSGNYDSGKKLSLSKSKLSSTKANAIKEFFNLDFIPKADDSFYADAIDASIDKETQNATITKVKWEKAKRSCIYSLNNESINKDSIEAQENIPSLYTIYVDSNGNTKLINCSINNNYNNSNSDYNDMQIWNIESDGEIISESFSNYSNSSNNWIDEQSAISKTNFAFSW